MLTWWGTPGDPRASVGKMVRDGLIEDYRHDLARRSQPVSLDEARQVALRQAQLHPSQRRRWLFIRTHRT